MIEKYLNLFTDYGFKRLFEKASIAKFTRDERQSYENSLKYYRDMKNVIDTHVEEAEIRGEERGIEKGIAIGVEKGREEGISIGFEKGEFKKALEIARNLLDVLDNQTIAKKTGLSVEKIQALREKNN
jgi:predicted transposase YdaD